MLETFENYRQVYTMLEDQESRDIYLNKLNWLISGDKKYIDSIVAAYLPQAPARRGNSLRDLKERIGKDEKIVLYGAGSMGRKLLPLWKDDERFIGFCSQTREKQQNGYCGYPVMSPEELLSRKDLTVIISTTRADEEIRQILLDGGYPEDQVYRLVEYDTYEDPHQYFPAGIITFGKDEILVDVGCFDLNSSLEMRKRCSSLKKVYALEPDPASYEVCLERKKRFHFEEVELLPVGAWSERTTLHFNATNDGLSEISKSGDTIISVAPIDEVLDPIDKITMIKMDIEGAELEALKGARNTIERDKPKLAICMYHKPEDLITIPLYIKKLVPEYKLYIRHHTNIFKETVLYAVMPQTGGERG